MRNLPVASESGGPDMAPDGIEVLSKMAPSQEGLTDELREGGCSRGPPLARVRRRMP